MLYSDQAQLLGFESPEIKSYGGIMGERFYDTLQNRASEALNGEMRQPYTLFRVTWPLRPWRFESSLGHQEKRHSAPLNGDLRGVFCLERSSRSCDLPKESTRIREHVEAVPKRLPASVGCFRHSLSPHPSRGDSPLRDPGRWEETDALRRGRGADQESSCPKASGSHQRGRRPWAAVAGRTSTDAVAWLLTRRQRWPAPLHRPRGRPRRRTSRPSCPTPGS